MVESKHVIDPYLPRTILLTSLALALLSLGLYLRTLHPGVGPSLDSMELQTAALVRGVIHPPGSPQYLVLGRLAMALLPGPNEAYRLNLLSALAAASTIGVVYLLTYRLTRNLITSVYASLALAMAVRLWYQASIAELYALNALYVALTLYLLVAWHQTERPALFWAAVIIYALSFGNHYSMILLLPAFFYVVEITNRDMLWRPRHLLVVVGIVGLAALQYLYVPLRAAANPPFCNYCPSLSALPSYLAGGPFKQRILGLSLQAVLLRLPDSMGQWGMQFMPWGYVLGAIGAWELVQENAKLGWFLVVALVSQYAFVMTYDIPDWHDFMTPIYVISAPMLGYGLLRIWEVASVAIGKITRGGRDWNLWQVIPLLVVVAVLLTLGLSFYVNLPQVDQSQESQYETLGRALLQNAKPGAWLLIPHPNSAAFYYSWALRYLAFAENPELGLVAIMPPEVNPPPGPEPYYKTWDSVAGQLEGTAIRHSTSQLFILDPGDERVESWVLLPICGPDGEMIAGYEVVGVRVDDTTSPIVSSERWEAEKDNVVFDGQEAHCPH